MKSAKDAMCMYRNSGDSPHLRIHGKPWEYEIVNKRMRRSAQKLIRRMK